MPVPVASLVGPAGEGPGGLRGRPGEEDEVLESEIGTERTSDFGYAAAAIFNRRYCTSRTDSTDCIHCFPEAPVCR